MRFHVHGTWRLQKNPTIPTMSMQQLLSDVNVCDVIWLSSHVVGSVRLATSVHVHGTTSDVCASETWHTKIRVEDGDTYARIKIHTHTRIYGQNTLKLVRAHSSRRSYQYILFSSISTAWNAGLKVKRDNFPVINKNVTRFSFLSPATTLETRAATLARSFLCHTSTEYISHPVKGSFSLLHCDKQALGWLERKDRKSYF